MQRWAGMTNAGRPWLLYGASGYTGRLIAEQAVLRGHRPLLAGRTPDRLRPLAQRLGLEHAVVGLEDERALARAIDGAPLVLNAAGPFAHTSAPLVRACLAAKSHYADINGEIGVFEANLARGAEARAAGIAILSGAGFDVVAMDCAARFVADRVPDATRLSIGFADPGPASAGVLKTVLESARHGVVVRRDGQLVEVPAGRGVRRVRFADRERRAMPMSWGDVSTAFRTTGIPNITTYMATTAAAALGLRLFFPVVGRLLRVGWVRRAAQRLAGALVRGPGAAALARTTSQVWARAENDRGETSDVWIETVCSYPFTARAAVLCVEKILAGIPAGATTPARAFGADFVLEIPGSQRHEKPR